MTKKTVGIIGFGEVGKAIHALAKKSYRVFTRDLTFDEIAHNQIDILNICIPYSKSFETIVIKAIQDIQPKLVIIHATVKPGTTRSIYNQTKVPTAHTPIMGVHPHLADYQSIFTKIIGAIDDKTYKQVRTFWKSLGAKKIVRFDRPEESEMGKIICTTYYGWNIVFNKAVKRLTEEQQLNFDQVYTQINQIYNQGYKKNLPYVIRPNLKYVEGPIGGHCVLPNAAFMQDDGEVFAEFMRLADKFS